MGIAVIDRADRHHFVETHRLHICWEHLDSGIDLRVAANLDLV
jgi:hypothetical protein